MEEEGVYYWFDAHEAPGTMHLADNSGVAHQKLPVTDTLHYGRDSRERGARGRDHALDQRAGGSTPASIRRVDSDFKAIRGRPAAAFDARQRTSWPTSRAFGVPGRLLHSDAGADQASKVRGEELAARRDRQWAA